MRENTKNKKSIIVKQWKVIFTISVLMLLIIASSFLILTGIPNKLKQKKELYTYQVNDDINYKVNFNDNNFFDTPSLPMDNNYISNLTKDIDVDFMYYYANSKKLDLNYTYDITATIKGNYGTNADENSNTVWNKSYTLEEPITEMLKNNNLININKSLKIDFKYYQNIVDHFKTQLDLAIDAYLDVVLTVKVDSIDNKLSDMDTLGISIPLSNSTYKITKLSVDNNKKSVFDERVKSKINVLRVTIGTIILVISVVGVSIMIYVLIKITRKSEYLLKLKKIYKNFGEIIVEVSNEPSYKDINIIDLEEELRIPILHYEKEKNIESYFFIIKDKQIYRYVLKVDKIEDISSPIRKANSKIKYKKKSTKLK